MTSGIMPLLLVTVASMVQTSGACDLFSTDYRHGEDYMSCSSVYSLNQCKYKCKSTPGCSGITWAKNYFRANCALYDYRGIQSGVSRRGQDSYINCNSEGDSVMPGNRMMMMPRRRPTVVPPAVDNMVDVMMRGRDPDLIPDGEDSCSGSEARAASGVDVFCLNDAGTISCSSDRDCPDPVNQTLTDGRRGYNTFSFPCELESRVCLEDSPLICECNEGDGENCLLRMCNVNDLDDRNCFSCGGPRVIGGEALTRATGFGGQTLRSQTLAQRSGCPNTTPCRYRDRSGPFCGRLVGLGRGGSVPACPKRGRRRG